MSSYRSARLMSRVWLATVLVVGLLLSAQAGEAKVIAVGVYKGSLGADNIVKALNEAEGFQAERFDKKDDLKNKELLLKYDVIVIPHSGYNWLAGAVYDRGRNKNRDVLGAYVSCGHGLLMCHYGIGGYRCVPEAFPEVGKNFHRMNENVFIVKNQKHPVMQGLPDRFMHAYYDQTLLEVGPRGTVLAENKAGFPTIVGGTLGNGRIVMTGSLLGFSGDATRAAPFGAEKQFLYNAVRWLGTARKRDTERFEDWRELCDARLQSWMLWREVGYWVDQIHYEVSTAVDVAGWDLESLLEREKLPEKQVRALQEELKRIRDRYDPLLAELIQQNDEAKAELDKMSFGRPEKRTIDRIRATQRSKRDLFMRKIGQIQAQKPWLVDPLQQRIDGLKYRAGPPEANVKPPTWLQDEFFRTIMFTGYWSGKAEFVMKAYRAAGANAMHCYGGSFQAVVNAMKKDGHILPLIRQTSAGYNYFDLENDLEGRLAQAAKMDDCPSFIGFQMDEPVARVGASEQSLAYFRAQLKKHLTREQLKAAAKKWDGMEGCYRITPQGIQNMTKARRGKLPAEVAEKLGSVKDRVYATTEKFEAAVMKAISREELDAHKGTILGYCAISPPAKITCPIERVLWVEWQELLQDTMSKYMEAFDKALAEKRPNLAVYPVLQQWLPEVPQRAALRLNSSVLRGCSTDIYNTGNYETALQLDLLRADAKGNTGLCAGTCYENSPHSFERDICIPLAHGTGIWVWNWFYQAPYRIPMMWTKWKGWLDYTWRPGMWDATVRTFQKMKKLEPYLVKTGSPSKIALLYSERTGIVDSYLDREKRVYGHEISQYFYNNMGWYHALAQSHVQVDPRYTDSLTAERLQPYAVALLVDARALREETVGTIRQWVQSGGILIATSQTSLTDEWGNERPEKTYALGDLFGVKFVEETTGAKAIQIAAGDALLGDLKPEATVTYDARRQYDKVQPTTGKVVAKFDTGDPAVVVNATGKGRTLLIAARKIGMAYEGAMYAGETKNHFKDYFPGVRELMTNVVVNGLAAAGHAPPGIASCDKNVEAIVRTQPKRYIVHLTNYTYRTPVSGASVQVSVPGGKVSKVFYPSDGVLVDHDEEELGTIEFRVRDFDVHEAVVVEWE